MPSKTNAHMACVLSTGLIVDGTIECDCHGSQFDLGTGQPVSSPARQPIRTYPVHVRGDDVFVEV